MRLHSIAQQRAMAGEYVGIGASSCDWLERHLFPCLSLDVSSKILGVKCLPFVCHERRLIGLRSGLHTLKQFRLFRSGHVLFQFPDP